MDEREIHHQDRVTAVAISRALRESGGRRSRMPGLGGGTLETAFGRCCDRRPDRRRLLGRRPRGRGGRGALVGVAIVVLAVRDRPRGAIGDPPADAEPRRLLVVVSRPVEEAEAIDEIAALGQAAAAQLGRGGGPGPLAGADRLSRSLGLRRRGSAARGSAAAGDHGRLAGQGRRRRRGQSRRRGPGPGGRRPAAELRRDRRRPGHRRRRGGPGGGGRGGRAGADGCGPGSGTWSSRPGLSDPAAR